MIIHVPLARFQELGYATKNQTLYLGCSDIVPMACAFTHDIFEMIAMIVEVSTPCWLSDQAAARKLETPTV